MDHVEPPGPTLTAQPVTSHWLTTHRLIQLGLVLCFSGGGVHSVLAQPTPVLGFRWLGPINPRPNTAAKSTSGAITSGKTGTGKTGTGKTGTAKTGTGKDSMAADRFVADKGGTGSTSDASRVSNARQRHSAWQRATDDPFADRQQRASSRQPRPSALRRPHRDVPAPRPLDLPQFQDVPDRPQDPLRRRTSAASRLAGAGGSGIADFPARNVSSETFFSPSGSPARGSDLSSFFQNGASQAKSSQAKSSQKSSFQEDSAEGRVSSPLFRPAVYSASLTSGGEGPQLSIDRNAAGSDSTREEPSSSNLESGLEQDEQIDREKDKKTKDQLEDDGLENDLSEEDPDEPDPSKASDRCRIGERRPPVGLMTINVFPEDEPPEDCPLVAEGTFARGQHPITYTWVASSLCHKPLYFEEVALERYGHTRAPWLQPLISGATFLLSVPVLPYKMGLEPPGECLYALGYYRPGNCAPYLRYRIPFQPKGALLQAAVVGGLIALIP